MTFASNWFIANQQTQFFGSQNVGRYRRTHTSGIVHPDFNIVRPNTNPWDLALDTVYYDATTRTLFKQLIQFSVTNHDYLKVVHPTGLEPVLGGFRIPCLANLAMDAFNLVPYVGNRTRTNHPNVFASNTGILAGQLSPSRESCALHYNDINWIPPRFQVWGLGATVLPLDELFH